MVLLQGHTGWRFHISEMSQPQFGREKKNLIAVERKRNTQASQVRNPATTTSGFGSKSIDRPLWEGYHESQKCSREIYPESCITKNTSMRKIEVHASQGVPFALGSAPEPWVLDRNPLGIQPRVE